MTLIDELREHGFTPSAVRMLAESGVIRSIDELRTKPWEDTPEQLGLEKRILMARNGNRKVLNQVEAFRAYGDASVRAPGPISVTVKLEPELAQALDRWIALQPTAVSRPDAVRAMVAASLQIMSSDVSVNILELE